MAFKKGQSGNPGGRPKRDLTLTGALRLALRQKAHGGQTHLELIALKLLAMAEDGNLEAIKLAFERIDGKVIERIEQTGPDGGPFLLRVAVVHDRDDPEPRRLEAVEDAGIVRLR
jgi:hypothetical protein